MDLPPEQLYSTASYKAQNLDGIDFGPREDRRTLWEVNGVIVVSRNNLNGWDLSNQRIRNAQLDETLLIRSNLSGADLSNSTLAGDELTESNFAGAKLSGTTLRNASAARANSIMPT